MTAKSVIVGMLLVGLALTAGMPVSLMMDAGKGPVSETNESATPASGALEGVLELAANEDTAIRQDPLTIFEDGYLSIGCSGNVNITFSMEDGIMTFVPVPDWNGFESVTLSAAYPFDPQLVPPGYIPNPPEDYTPFSSGPGEHVVDGVRYDFMPVNITIFPVNDPPRLNYCLAPLAVQGGAAIPSAIDLAPMFTEVDGDQLVYTVASLGRYVVPYISGKSVGLAASDGFKGYETIIITASDEQFTVSTYIMVNVGEPYALPMSEDVPYELDPADYFTFGNVAQVSVLSPGDLGAAYASEDNGTWTLGLQGKQDWSGATYMTALVDLTWWMPWFPTPAGAQGDDAISSVAGYWHHENVFMTFKADVSAVNDPPKALAQQPLVLTTKENTPFYIALNVNDLFSDVDSPLTFGYTTSGAYASLQITDTGIVSVIPNKDSYGTQTFDLTASDGEYTANCTLIAHVTKVDDSIMALSGNGTLVIDEDAFASVNLSYMFFDEDGVTGYSCVASGNFTVAIDAANQTALVTPAVDWNGIENMAFNGTDGLTWAGKEITVVVNPVNDPPTIASDIQPVTMDEETTAAIPLTGNFQDVDSALAYSVASTSANISVGVADGTLSIVPAENWNGEASVTVTASDGEYSASTAFTVAVAPVNDPPTLVSPIAQVTIQEDGSAAVNMASHFSDVDDALEYTAAGTLDYTITISGDDIATVTPRPGWHGSGIVSLGATDGESWLNESVEVAVLAVNHAPVVLRSIHAASVTAGNATLVDVSGLFSDPDGDALAVSVGGSGNLEYGMLANGMIEIKTRDAGPGTYAMKVTASDGQSVAEAGFDVVVMEKQQAAAQAGLPIGLGYGLSGGLMIASALAVAGFALFAKSEARNRGAVARLRRHAAANMV